MRARGDSAEACGALDDAIRTGTLLLERHFENPPLAKLLDEAIAARSASGSGN